jgi:hypothetical protein
LFCIAKNKESFALQHSIERANHVILSNNSAQYSEQLASFFRRNFSQNKPTLKKEDNIEEFQVLRVLSNKTRNVIMKKITVFILLSFIISIRGYSQQKNIVITSPPTEFHQLTDPMTQIGLSKDQESRIRAIRKMARKKQILISNQIISSPDRNNQFKSLKRLTKQQINEVLSNSQKEKLKSLEKQ